MPMSKTFSKPKLPFKALKKTFESARFMFPVNLSESINSLNNSKFVLGVMMLLINVGSRYIELGFTKTQEQALRNGLGRELLIFAIVFMGSHDIVTSILMTAAFVVLSDYLFNEKSKFCVLPTRLKKIAELVDENNDQEISPEEEKKALDVLQKAGKQKQQEVNNDLTSYIDLNNQKI